MKLLKQFLNYPNLFSGVHGTLYRVMAPAKPSWVGRANLTARGIRARKKTGAFSTGKLPAVPLVWGMDGQKNNAYWHRQSSTCLSKRNISLTEVSETAEKFTAKVAISHWSALDITRTGYNENNKKVILQIMADDLKTAAFSSVPWIKEIVDDFLSTNPTPWVTGNEGQTQQAEHIYVVPGSKLTEQQCKDIYSRLDSGWKTFTTNNKWPKDFKLKSPSFGVSDSRETPQVTPSPTIRTNPNSDKKEKSEAPYYNGRTASTPAHSFMLDVNNIEGCKLGVHICWRNHRIIESFSRRTPARRYQTATNINIWTPEIAGFSLIPVPNKGGRSTSISFNYDEVTPQLAGRATPGPKSYTIDNFVRVVDQTQKRTAKGGYRGDYQGIKTITFIPTGSTYWKIYQKNALATIATGAPITGKDFQELVGDSKRELPMSIETYKKLPRPEVDVKAIEIGHLLLYRIAECPPKQVSAEILSDMLLPSMPSLLLAVDSPLRIASNDSYTSGLECYGPCDDGETVDCMISPGLYTIARKEKCSRGHDPGRKEYTLGFGNHCNEIITIRRMLAELQVFYDEFRGNYVGSVITEPSPAQQRPVSASRLLGRF
jgi:hypothetical protein